MMGWRDLAFTPDYVASVPVVGSPFIHLDTIRAGIKSSALVPLYKTNEVFLFRPLLQSFLPLFFNFNKLISV